MESAATRPIALALLLAAEMALIALPAPAQQKPIYGCNAAPSCRPLGYPSFNSSNGVSGMFFGVGMAFGPGYNIHLVTPANAVTLVQRPVPDLSRGVFHLNASLIPPTPVPEPTPTPVAPR